MAKLIKPLAADASVLTQPLPDPKKDTGVPTNTGGGTTGGQTPFVPATPEPPTKEPTPEPTNNGGIKEYTDGTLMYNDLHDANMKLQADAKGQGYTGANSKDYYTNEARPNATHALQLKDGATMYYNKGPVVYSGKWSPNDSGANRDLLSAEGNAQMEVWQQEYYDKYVSTGTTDSPEARALLAKMHEMQARVGYITDWDGSNYRTLGAIEAWGDSGVPSGAVPGAGLPGGTGGMVQLPGGNAVPSVGNSQRDLLNRWQQAAGQQAAGQIDYAVNQGVTELQRALEDAQALYKEQAETVAKDEMQALDNSALYAEARGDKGGIGHSQYNEIQSAAAQNRLAVQQAQTKLSTDTARQIADLRAQGEFEKADKLLEITQNYLSQLMNLEQWAAEFGFSKEQFQASLDQWQQEFDFAVGKYADSLAQTKNNQLADIASALLGSGIALDADQLAALGMSEGQMNQMLMQYQLEQEAGKQTPAAEPTMSLATAKQAASKGVFSDAVLSVLRANGYDDEMLSAIYGYKPQGELIEPGNPALGLSSYAQQMAQALTESVFSSTADAAAYIQANLGKLDEAEAGYLLSLIGY